MRVLHPGDSWLKLKTSKKPNVVIVLMESFSGRFCGAVGAPRSFTPEFDKIASEGVLFKRAFSAGSHTHQGLFATLLGFPNLPGYGTLMQDSISKQPFSSVPGVLKQNGYQTLMLYNGDFAWDNMYGMFRDQGVDRFIGRQEFSAEKQVNATWGVADDAVFERANQEFEEMARIGPFCGLIVTLSNHVPFILPEPLPFPKITDMGERNDRLNAMRFADWSIGQFITEAKKKNYFKNTLFVFVGDHGFQVSPKMTDVDLLFHHVPLLFYGPGVLSPETAVREEVACQVNIAPSIFGLLGIKTPVALWARSLFSNAYADPNWAIFKNSSGSTAVAMAREDKLLCIDTAGKPGLYRYSLSFPPSLEPLNEPETKKRMEHQLRAYIQGAMVDLLTYDGSHKKP
jgi:phosphoglycerol transferase MdoB-like AlkP superfamily enzyme